MKVTSILLWVQENRLSQKFYKKLGFEITASDDQHSIVKLSDFQMTLVNMRDEDEFAKDAMAAERGRGVYIYIKVDDVDKEYKRQESLGFKPAIKPRDWPWGNREFVLKDPDGYKLCFWHETVR